MNYTHFETPLCEITVAGDEAGIRHLYLHHKEAKRAPLECAGWRRDDAFFEEARRQLEAFLGGRLERFSLPIAPQGTEFQRQVWHLVAEIPFGETRTYGALAAALGSPKASRAVGLANGQNPIPLIIPCHRVIGADGALRGFAFGLSLKKKLLELEHIGERAPQKSLFEKEEV